MSSDAFDDASSESKSPRKASASGREIDPTLSVLRRLAMEPASLDLGGEFMDSDAGGLRGQRAGPVRRHQLGGGDLQSVVPLSRTSRNQDPKSRGSRVPQLWVFLLFAFFGERADDLPDVVGRREMVAPVAGQVLQPNEVPSLQFLQAHRDVGAREERSLGRFLDVPPIHIRPIGSRECGCRSTNPMGSSRYGGRKNITFIFSHHEILRRICQESTDKGLKALPLQRAYWPS
jgi:hypothetical protein